MKFTDIDLVVSTKAGKRFEIEAGRIISIHARCGSVQIEFLHEGIKVEIDVPLDQVEILPKLKREDES